MTDATPPAPPEPPRTLLRPSSRRRPPPRGHRPLSWLLASAGLVGLVSCATPSEVDPSVDPLEEPEVPLTHKAMTPSATSQDAARAFSAKGPAIHEAGIPAQHRGGARHLRPWRADELEGVTSTPSLPAKGARPGEETGPATATVANADPDAGATQDVSGPMAGTVQIVRDEDGVWLSLRLTGGLPGLHTLEHYGQACADLVSEAPEGVEPLATAVPFTLTSFHVDDEGRATIHARLSLEADEDLKARAGGAVVLRYFGGTAPPGGIRVACLNL